MSATLSAFSSLKQLSGPRGSTLSLVPESSKRAACSFEPAKDVKDVAVSDDGRKLRIGMALDPK
jgi:hypothetical protein